MRVFYLFLLFSLPAIAQNTLPAIGLWREHLPYQGTIDVTASDKKIYAATPFSFFSVDIATKEIQRFSKVSGLAQTGISAIQFDQASKKLFVAYTNSNIDVLDEKNIHNIPAIKRSAISGDKNIYGIYPDGAACYLSTGLGIVVLDADKYEVKESWFIGNNGGYVKINGFTKTSSSFYAATNQGLKKTASSTSNPANFQAWQTISGTNGLAVGIAKAVVSFSNKVVVLQNDSLFFEDNGVWKLFFSNGQPITSINASGNQLLVCQQTQVIILNENGLVQRSLQRNGQASAPQKAVAVANEYWVADLDGGLVNFTSSGVEGYKLNSPQTVVYGEMTIINKTLWATAGTVNGSWNYQYNPNGVFKLEANNYWSAYNLYNYKQLDSLLDFITVAVNPQDNTAWAGSFGGGLVHIDNTSTPKIFKQNSPLLPAIGDPGSYRVAGLAFDEKMNLWMSNFASPKQLHVIKPDGSWQSFTAPFLLNQNAVAQIIIDNANQKWIQSPLGNGLLVFNENDFANTVDDQWRLFKADNSTSGLPSNEVLCLAKDRNGFIWVGTSDGVAVFQCPESVFTNGCEALRPIIKQGAFASYLFKSQEVRSIAVDGANRKWIGTNSGLWLVGEDGDKVLANYTEQNSPLLSNDVKRIAVDGSTGEIFVATAKGLISFRGAATQAEETKQNVFVFPNPVPPGFTGTIGIRGLPENSFVKITEANGRLVYQTKALGGQAVWNGRDYKGSKAATGIYLVITVSETNIEKVVGKIVLIGQ